MEQEKGKSEAMKPAEINGKRYYGRNNCVPENPERCIEEVSDRGRWAHYHQCTNKRGYGPDGLYCAIHDPAAVEARKAKAEAEYQNKSAQRHKLLRAQDIGLLLIQNGVDTIEKAQDLLNKVF